MRPRGFSVGQSFVLCFRVSALLVSAFSHLLPSDVNKNPQINRKALRPHMKERRDMATEKSRRAARSDAPKPESILSQLAFGVFVLALFFGLPHVLGVLYQQGVI